MLVREPQDKQTEHDRDEELRDELRRFVQAQVALHEQLDAVVGEPDEADAPMLVVPRPLRLLTALIEPGRAELPAHDDPNHVVICAADDSRAEAMAAHFSRRIPITVRSLSEIDDMTMLGLSEDLPESWTTFETKRVIR